MKAIHDKKVCGFLLSIAACLSQTATAAGFYIPEVGSPASLGTGGVANPTNTFGADAAWTNPAGMTGLQRDQIFSGVQAVIPRMEFDSSTATAGGSDGGNAGNTAIIPGLFYVNKLNDRTRLGMRGLPTRTSFGKTAVTASDFPMTVHRWITNTGLSTSLSTRPTNCPQRTSGRAVIDWIIPSVPHSTRSGMRKLT